MKATMRMPYARNMSSVRFVVLGIVTVIVLAIVFQSGTRTTHLTRDSKSLSLNLVTKEKNERNGEYCQAHFDEIFNEANLPNLESVLKNGHTISKNAVLSYLDITGDVLVKPLDIPNIRPIAATLFGSPRQSRRDGSDTIFLYPDKTAVVVNANCLVKAVYMPGSRGDFHPAIDKSSTHPAVTVSSDDACCNPGPGSIQRARVYTIKLTNREKSCFDRCECYNTCNCDARDNSHREGSWRDSNRLYCEDCPGVISCQHQVDGVPYFQLGKCAMQSSTCNFDNYFPMAERSVSVLKVITKTIAIASVVPGVTSTPLYGLSATMGFLEQSSSAVNVYNAVMVKLNDVTTKILACVDIHVGRVYETGIQTTLGEIQTLFKNLVAAQNTVSSIPAAVSRIGLIHLPVLSKCANIDARITTLVQNQHLSEIALATHIMPYSVRAMMLCSQGYNMAMIDMLTANKTHDLANAKTQYQTFAENMVRSVAMGINKFEDFYGSVKRCGFFDENKKALCAKMSYLRAYILGPIGKVALAMFEKCIPYYGFEFGANTTPPTTVASFADCMSSCYSDKNCHCFSYHSSTQQCYRKSDDNNACSTFTTRSNFESGICSGQAAGQFGLVVEDDMNSNGILNTVRCDEQCSKSKNCVGYRVQGDECYFVGDEADAMSSAVDGVFFRDSAVLKTTAHHVSDLGLASDHFSVPHWGSCLAVCSLREKCVAADVRMDGKVECYLYDRGVSHELTLNEKGTVFKHFNILRGIRPASLTVKDDVTPLFFKCGPETCTLRDVALQRPTAQSSTFQYEHASRAVNGVWDGQLHVGGCSHTNDEFRPWWYVDLGAFATVCSVEIMNRADCCPWRLTDFDIYLAASKPVIHNGIWSSFSSGHCKGVTGSFQGRKTFECTANQGGRYVVIQLRGTGYLTLCGVAVKTKIGDLPPGLPSCPSTNIAWKKPAKQFGGDVVSASRPVSYISSGLWAEGTCSWTGQHNNQRMWWYVDLGAQYRIATINLTNRADCCSYRLDNFDIFVTKAEPTDGFQWALDSERCVHMPHEVPPNNVPLTFRCVDPTLSGRYVGVRMRPSTHGLTICGVSITGCRGPCSENVALQHPTGQSSTAYHGYSSNAVSGFSSGIFTDATCTATAHQANPWWYVDLGASVQLCSVTVANRVECCAERLANFVIFATNTKPQSGNALSSSYQTCAESASYFTGTKTFECPHIRGQYVGVLLRGAASDSLLTICGFSVRIGLTESIPAPPVPCPLRNIAWAKQTGQSAGIYSLVRRPVTSLTPSQNWADGTCSHSWGNNVRTFWYVDLAQRYRIATITLTNRNVATERLSNFDIFVRDTPPEPGYVVPDSERCFYMPWTVPGVKSFRCVDPNLSGRYVGVQMRVIYYLTICGASITGCLL